MKREIIKKIIALVISLLLIIIALVTIRNMSINAKERDAKILKNHQCHIDLIKLLKVEFNSLSAISYKMSRLNDERLFSNQEKSINNRFIEIHKLTDVLLKGGVYNHHLKINYNNENIFVQAIDYQPDPKEILLELIELQPRIKYVEQITQEFVSQVGLYYNDTIIVNYHKAVSLYKQQQSLINRAIEINNRAFISAFEYKNLSKKTIEKREKNFIRIRWSVIFVLMLVMVFYLTQAIRQISQIVDKHEEAAKKLEESNKTIQKILDSLPVGIAIANRKQEIRYINKMALTWMKETDSSNYIGSHCSNVFCLDDEDACPLTLDKIALHDIEIELKQADGNKKTIIKSAIPLRLDDEDVILEAFMDISKQKEDEYELRKLSRVVEESPASIVITNENGSIEYVNPKFLENTGYVFEEVKGKNPRLINARSKDNEVDYKDMWNTILGGNVWRGEFCNRRKDGSIFWELASISPLKNKLGVITHFIAVKDDITDRKQFERKLELEKIRANSANEAKGFFLAKMSHEIRTPMNGIIGMTDILLGCVKDEDIAEKLKVISVSAENLLIIINEILDFSKIEAGQVELESIPINLKELLSEVESLLLLKAKAKDLYLKIRISDNLPEWFNGDPTRIKQIIINLVNNAINFTETGGITVFVEKKKEAKDKNDFILGISIIDTGIGISEEGKSKLFKAFSQTSSSTTRTHGGTGLGLLISKDLAKLMGGVIGIDSQVGEGSTFWVEIPTSKASKDDSSLSEKEMGRSRTLGNLHILVAEDNAINQKIAQLNLEKLGHKVQFANNGLEAVDLFKQDSFDVIFMDIQMPKMGGLEATELIRAYEDKKHITNSIPIIALTANALTTDKAEYIAAGMNYYLSKPFKQKDLVEVLNSIWDKADS